MSGKHDKIYSERSNQLRNLILKEFSSKQFEIQFDPVIAVSYNGPGVTAKRTPRIIFSPTEEFMTDLDSDFDQTSKQAIELAKKILENPRFPAKSKAGKS